MSSRTLNLASKHSIPKMHGIDINVDNFLLTQVLPTIDIMAAFDASSDQKRLNNSSYANTILSRPLTTSDIIEYTSKEGFRVGELNRNVGAKLWNEIINISHFILAGAQHKTSKSISDLGPIIPKDHLTSLQVPFPSIVLLRRHSGANPFFVNATMGAEEIATLYRRLQYVGKIALCWVDYTTNQCIYRDSFGRWKWTHYNQIQPARKNDTRIRRLLRAIGGYTETATQGYFGGDEKFVGYDADFDYSPTGHGESAYCRAHPNYDPYVIVNNPMEYIDASFDNTDALLPVPPPSSPAPIPIDAHTLAGYARCEPHPAFAPFPLPTVDEDVEMMDAADDQKGQKEVTDEEMAIWMSRIQLNERLGSRNVQAEEARRWLAAHK
ncbi:hypothetical protein C8R43DRAFT_944210 [Mycena crocata]|nr:hypothetical protein C8R43DRAFT_944210 [Mycena crocata]